MPCFRISKITEVHEHESKRHEGGGSGANSRFEIFTPPLGVFVWGAAEEISKWGMPEKSLFYRGAK
jgi:hypothetical protein